MKTVGIICEYDPFHRGHRKQFQWIREKEPEARIVCLMSGPFTQRGCPALFSPERRSGAALSAGADLVLELPGAFVLRDAERFALGAVDILNRLGFVDELCFGCEDDLEKLIPAAELLEHPTDAFRLKLKAGMENGLSFPAAQGKTLEELLPGGSCFARPNNILAICYLRALMRTDSALNPCGVHRQGNYHEQALLDLEAPSASAIRHAFGSDSPEQAEAACGYSVEGWAKADMHALESLLLWKLRSMSTQELAALPDCREGMENRVWKLARECLSREELLSRLKTRRYTYARLSRLCCHALLDVTEKFLADHPVASYVRILAIRPDRISTRLKESQIPLLSRAAEADRGDALFQLDERMYDLWALAAGLPAGLIYREKIFRI